jgi:hypothetical protein
MFAWTSVQAIFSPPGVANYFTKIEKRVRMGKILRSSMSTEEVDDTLLSRKNAKRYIWG